MKRKFLSIVVLLLSVLLTLTICACSNNNDDEEITTTYTYSFTIGSTDYTYELMIGSTGSWNLELKEGSTEVYQFNELSFLKESETLYKMTNYDDDASLLISIKPIDNTFEIYSISGEILNLILGYEVYAGDYTATSGVNTVEITLHNDGTYTIGDDEETFLPWHGGSVILSDSTSSVVCSIDFEENQLSIEGAATNDIGYIFDAVVYDYDFASYLSTENCSTKLHLSQNGNQAYFQKTSEISPFSYHLYFGSYETTDETINFSYGDNNIDFLVSGLLFDYYYEEYAVGENWIKLYEQENKTVYKYEDTLVSGDSVPSDENSYILYKFSQDIVPVKVTYVIDSENLDLISTYIGNFKGVEGDTYTASDNSEIVIVDNDTLYHCSGNYTQTKLYAIETYSASNYDPNVINMQTGYISHYYLDGDTFYYYSPLTNEEKLQVIDNPSQFIYGKDIEIGENTADLVTLAISSTNNRATLLAYNLAIGSIGTIQHSSIITGDLDINGSIYQITSDEAIYDITVSEGVITEISIS